MWPCKSNTQFLPAILPKPHSNAIRNPGALASGVRAPPNTKERTILYDGAARTCSPTVHEHATATASSSPASRRWLAPSSEITICQEFRHMGPTIRAGTKSSSIAAAYAVRTESRPSVWAKAGANTRQLALARWLVPKSHTHTHRGRHWATIADNPHVWPRSTGPLDPSRPIINSLITPVGPRSGRLIELGHEISELRSCL